jgi:uncharacterized protein DUF1616
VLIITTNTTSPVINRHTIIYILFVIIGTLLLFVGSYIEPILSQDKHQWALAKEPENITELYFTDHTKLPKKYTPGQTYQLSFDVHNKESESVTYTYKILQQDDSIKSIMTTLKTGSFVVENGKVHTEAINITYADSNSRSKIIVELPKQKQAIHYWVER